MFYISDSIISGEIPLDEAPGMGIVLPGGLNMYYIDIAPKTEGALVCLRHHHVEFQFFL